MARRHRIDRPAPRVAGEVQVGVADTAGEISIAMSRGPRSRRSKRKGRWGFARHSRSWRPWGCSFWFGSGGAGSPVANRRAGAALVPVLAGLRSDPISLAARGLLSVGGGRRTFRCRRLRPGLTLFGHCVGFITTSGGGRKRKGGCGSSFNRPPGAARSSARSPPWSRFRPLPALRARGPPELP